MNNQIESTYVLLIHSEEKGRGLLETLVYALFILSVVLSVWQFAQTPIEIPLAGRDECVARHTTTTPLPQQS